MPFEEAVNNIKNNPDAELRRNSVIELMGYEELSSSAIEALVRGIEDSDLGVKDMCAKALSALSGGNAAEASEMLCKYIVDEDFELRNLAGDILTKIGTEAVEPLIPYMKHENQDVRKFACDILGLIGDERPIPDIYPLFADEDLNVVNSAIEALGNIRSEEALDSLMEIYEVHEDLKPNALDALGKIGGQKAQEFLLEKLDAEEDPFLQVEAIDTLAVVGTDMMICERLLEKIYNFDETVQVIFLKAIYAIAFRLEAPFFLPDEFRKIAQLALFDDDPDIRAAGLLALGEIYEEEDVEALVNEVLTNDAGTQQRILYCLMANSEPKVVNEFFKVFFTKSKPDGADVDFLTMLYQMQDQSSPDNADESIRTLIYLLVTFPRGNSSELLDILVRMNDELVISEIKKYFTNGNPGQIDEAMDMCMQIGPEAFKEELEIISQQGGHISQKANEILSELN